MHFLQNNKFHEININTKLNEVQKLCANRGCLRVWIDVPVCRLHSVRHLFVFSVQTVQFNGFNQLRVDEN